MARAFCPPPFFSGAAEQPDRSYFLPVPAGGGLEGGCFFGWEELLALACFCEDFFWFALGDLSPMVVVWLLGWRSLATT